MKRTLGILLAVVFLAGCGSQSSSTATDSGGSAAPDPNGTVDFTRIALLTATGGGGQVDPVATALGTPAQVATFVKQFRSPALADRVRQAVAGANVPAGSTVVGAVVSLGCDRPPGIDVIHGTGQVQIIPHEVASPLQECLAPMTTVAIVAVPQA